MRTLVISLTLALGLASAAHGSAILPASDDYVSQLPAKELCRLLYNTPDYPAALRNEWTQELRRRGESCGAYDPSELQGNPFRALPVPQDGGNAQDDRADGDERICRYARNIVIKVPRARPCPTFR